MLCRNYANIGIIIHDVTDKRPNPRAQPWWWGGSWAHQDTHGWRLSLTQPETETGTGAPEKVDHLPGEGDISQRQ